MAADRNGGRFKMKRVANEENLPQPKKVKGNDRCNKSIFIQW